MYLIISKSLLAASVYKATNFTASYHLDHTIEYHCKFDVFASVLLALIVCPILAPLCS